MASEDRSDYEDAQADPRFRSAHMPLNCPFYMYATSGGVAKCNLFFVSQSDCCRNIILIYIIKLSRLSLIIMIHFRSDVDSLSQLEDLINKSAKSNTALRVTQGLGWYDWKQYFQTKFKPIQGIRKSRSFRFSATNPGDVFVKENLDSAERCLHILQVSPDVFERSFPEVLTPSGISRARQEYLFKRIRPFVKESFKDELCPSVEE